MEEITTPPEKSLESLDTGMSILLLIAGVCFGFAVTLAGVWVMDISKGVWNKVDLVLGTFSFIVPAALYTRLKKLSFTRVFRFNTVSWKIISFTFLLTFGLVIVTDTLDHWIAPSINAFLDSTIGTLSPELQSEKILAKLQEEMMIHDLTTGILLVLAAVIGAALCEEMLMRGMFQGALEKNMSPAFAIAISSFVFSLIHINPWGGIQIFVLAVFLGTLVWKTGSIWPTMIMHGTNNGLVIIFNNTDPAKLTWYGDTSHIETPIIFAGIILTLVGLLGIMRTTKGPA